MAAKSVNEFFDKVEGSKALQTKLKAMHKKIVDEGKTDVKAGIVKIASQAGFKFTAQELTQARAKVKKAPAGALSDVTGQEMCSMSYICTSSWYCAGYMYSQP
jgi:hypothetical protein